MSNLVSTGLFSEESINSRREKLLCIDKAYMLPLLQGKMRIVGLPEDIEMIAGAFNPVTQCSYHIVVRSSTFETRQLNSEPIAFWPELEKVLG